MLVSDGAVVRFVAVSPQNIVNLKGQQIGDYHEPCGILVDEAHFLSLHKLFGKSFGHILLIEDGHYFIE